MLEKIPQMRPRPIHHTWKRPQIPSSDVHWIYQAVEALHWAPGACRPPQTQRLDHLNNPFALRGSPLETLDLLFVLVESTQRESRLSQLGHSCAVLALLALLALKTHDR